MAEADSGASAAAAAGKGGGRGGGWSGGQGGRGRAGWMGEMDPEAARAMLLRARKVIDHSAPSCRYLKDRIFRPEACRSASAVDCAAGASSIDMMPPVACLANASTSICTRFVHSSFTKDRCPVNMVVWTPEGRRLVAGNNNGMFTMWSGINFTFETTQQAHETAVRAMVWSYSGEWMVSADHGGIIKYWQTTLNNVKEFEGHAGSPVRELSFCPTDAKFASCSDDATVKVWDFERGTLERLMPSADGGGKSHGWDVKTVQWHPLDALLASGSKDNTTKLWDPRAPLEIATLHIHKSMVQSLRWHSSGRYLLSGARDNLVKLFDLRAMREAAAYKAHKREVTSIAWHPLHAELFASGANDGALYFWSTANEDAPLAQATGRGGYSAHEQAIWSLAWHPLGHLLCTGSNDQLVKFWSRSRPGDGRKREREEGDEEFDDLAEMRLASLASSQQIG